MIRLLPLALVALLTGCDPFGGSCCSFNLPPLPPEPEPEPLGLSVTTDSGPIQGIDSERAAAWTYLGVPFAAPPVDELRWKGPKPVEPWTETRLAQELPNFCPQFLYFSNEFAGSEDCLYLNVFRPQTQERDLPIFVWIHGGGNNNGDTGQETPAYDGARLAERGNMVVVTVQYRLGALGWLLHPAFATDSTLDSSGNYGTADLIAALEWVQDNADAFGGDARNVTIAGESAGAANVLSLVISYRTSRLFQKGIIQSLGGRVTDRDVALAQSDALLDDLVAFSGVPEEPQTDEEIAAFLRGFDAETILTLANTSQIIGDGELIPEGGFDLLSTGTFGNYVPLLLGTNRDEYKLYTNPLGFNEYPDGPPELQEAVGRYLSDAWRVTGADDLATTLRNVEIQPDIYVYRFAWGSPDENGDSPLPGNFGETGGAFHSAEISFMMGNEDVFIFPDFGPFFYTNNNEASRMTMADIMVNYWSSFAWSSDPNGNSLPTWEPWVNGDGAFKAVVLDVSNADDSVKVDPDPTVLTEEEVYASANANLEGDILAEVIRRLDLWFAAF